jgi:hypothetical protein
LEQLHIFDVLRNEVLYSEKFLKPIALHAACGLLENIGIYIVGGRSSSNGKWVSDIFYFDLK